MISRMSEHERVIPRRAGRGGRPSKGPRTYVGLRVPDPLHEAIEEARAASGLSINDFVIGLAEAALAAGLVPSGHAPGQDRLPLSA
jgi:predicted HicB family RNase H-like nuclease